MDVTTFTTSKAQRCPHELHRLNWRLVHHSCVSGAWKAVEFIKAL